MQLVLKIFTLLITLLSFTNNYSAPISQQSIQSIVKATEEIADTYHDMGWYSGSLLIAKDDKIIFEKSYGYAHLDKIKNTANTKFNLGSVMKNLTKVLVLQQVADKKLSLDDTLDKFELNFPEDISSIITIDHLLNHSSGFADIFIAEYRENQLSFDTLDKKLMLLKDKPLLFEPGTDRSYSNYGYIVLGSILEKITNEPFTKLLENNIFNRVGLLHSTFNANESEKNQSIRYTYQYDGSIRKVGITEHPSPDGGTESNASDVQKFYRELFYGDKIIDRTNEIVRNAFSMNGEHWSSYGGGLGVSSAVEVNLVDGIEIVVLANTDNLVAERISQRIHSFIKTGSYSEILELETNYAYRYYTDKRKENLYTHFKYEYVKSCYTKFIGRTLNELGMQLLNNKAWDESLDIFNYLVSIFPTAPQAYDSLSYAYFTKGDVDKAHNIFKKALELIANFNSEYVSENYGNM